MSAKSLAPDSFDLASDRLVGVKAIADHRGEKPRRTDYLLRRGLIPAVQEGRVWISSKRALDEQHRRRFGLSS